MPDFLWIPIGIAAALVYAFGFCVALVIAKRAGGNEFDNFSAGLLWPILAVMFGIAIAGMLIYFTAEWFVDKVLNIK